MNRNNRDQKSCLSARSLTDPSAQIHSVDIPKLATELRKVIVTDKFKSPKNSILLLYKRSFKIETNASFVCDKTLAHNIFNF